MHILRGVLACQVLRMTYGGRVVVAALAIRTHTRICVDVRLSCTHLFKHRSCDIMLKDLTQLAGRTKDADQKF